MSQWFLRKVLFIAAGLVIAAHAMGQGNVEIKGDVRNGADGFEIGGVLRLFDEIESSKPFFPEDQTQVWSELDAQLTKLSSRLPITGNYLRSMFMRGRMTWTFVDAKLKDIKDEGRSNVIVASINGEQIAAHYTNVVQIRESSWNKLTNRARAMLFLHESLWVANGSKAFASGEQVRRIVGVLFDPKLDKYMTDNLVATLSLIFEKEGNAKSSPFYQRMKFEQSQLTIKSNFSVEEIYSEQSADLVISIKNPTPKLQITQFNPSPSAKYLKLAKNGLITAEDQGEHFAVGIDQLCKDFTYGKFADWRLPTKEEVWALSGLHLNRFKFVVSDRKVVTNKGFKDIPDGFLFPQKVDDQELRILTQEALIFNSAKLYRDETNKYEGAIQYFCVRDVP